tara:strand:- start:768 stop:947 length:180 start_codon:yes stop_codon:yes gene_type:complete
MLGLKRKTFWTILIGVNVTSAMICSFAGSISGVLVGAVSIAACYYMLVLCEKEEDDNSV